MTSKMTARRTTRRAEVRQRDFEAVPAGRPVRSPKRPPATRTAKPGLGAGESEDLAHKLHPGWTCWA